MIEQPSPPSFGDIVTSSSPYFVVSMTCHAPHQLISSVAFCKRPLLEQPMVNVCPVSKKTGPNVVNYDFPISCRITGQRKYHPRRIGTKDTLPHEQPQTVLACHHSSFSADICLHNSTIIPVVKSKFMFLYFSTTRHVSSNGLNDRLMTSA